jgi:hypothetical protein
MSGEIWLTPKDIGEILGLSERWIQILAVKKNWADRRRQDKGGGFEYEIHSLSACFQAKILLHLNRLNNPVQKPDEQDLHEDSKRQAMWAHYERRPAKIKAEAARKMEIMVALDDMISNGKKGLKTFEEVAKQTGENVKTLYRWRKSLKGIPRSDWLPTLAPDYAGRQVFTDISPEAWDYFKADYLRPEQPAATACYDRLKRAAIENVNKETGEFWYIPSLKTIMRKLEREIPNLAIKLAREGEKAALSAIPSQERDHSVFHALEAVNADGHVFDTFVLWPDDNQIYRPRLLSWHDIYSGVILGYRIDRTENVDIIRLSLGDVISKYGIPRYCYLDNGRGFASKWMTGGTKTRYRGKIKPEDPAGILTQLGVEVHWCKPAHGQSKPIERAHRDLCEYVPKHPALAGAYTGNNPMAKPENYRSRAVPLAEFLKVLDVEIQAHNERQGRKAKTCNGRSFIETFKESYEKSAIRKATPEQLRMFLLAAERVTVSKTDGSIEFLGNRYWNEQLSQYVGKGASARHLVARFDPQDLSKPLYIYLLDGRFVCEAGRKIAAGFNDTQAARDHNRARNQIVKANKKILESERRMSVIEAAQLLPGSPKPEEALDSKVVRPLFNKAPAQVVPEEPKEETENAFHKTMGKLIAFHR